MIELFKEFSIYIKIATVSFILGKLTFIPAAASLFFLSSNTSKILIFLYSFFIFLTIILCAFEFKRKKSNIDLIKEKIDLSSCNEKTFSIKVKDGKIIEIV